MPNNTYFIWEKTDIYTSYGISETWLLFREYWAAKRFDPILRLPGMLNNRSYQDTPEEIVPLQTPSSKVYYITTRANEAQAARRSFYSPMHKFCKTNGELVFAKDLKVGDVIVALMSEVKVEYIEIMDYGESHWLTLTTKGESPNIFVNSLLTFPSTFQDLMNFETSQDVSFVEKMEYEEPKTEPFDISKLDPSIKVIKTEEPALV